MPTDKVIFKAAEECGELIQCVMKYLRGDATMIRVKNEARDVQQAVKDLLENK